MGGVAPRFRRDLEATNVEADGIVYVEVSDRGGKTFRFYDFEHTVALALDGRPLGAVAEDLRRTSELDLSEEQLVAFAEQLAALGFLEDDARAVTPPPVAVTPPPVAVTPPPVAPPVFGPLSADESGQFAGPKIGQIGQAALNDPLDLGEFQNQPTTSGSDALAAAVRGTPARKTPGPVTETVPPQLAMDRTLTQYPPAASPQLRPADWLSTPEPEILPAKEPGKETGKKVPNLDAGPFALATPRPVPTSPSTPPPIPLAALAARAHAAEVPEPLPEMTDPDNALTAERPVIEFPDSLRGDDLEDLPALPERAQPAATSTDLGMPQAPAPTASAPLAPTTPMPAPAAPAPVRNGAAEVSAPFFVDIGQDQAESTRSSEPTVADLARPLDSDLARAAPTPASEAPTPPASPSASEREAARERPTQELRAVAHGPEPEPAEPAESNIAPPFAEPLAAPGGRRAWIAYAVLGVAAAIVIAAMFWKYFSSTEPAPLAVRTMVPAPTTIYRYWEPIAKIEPARAAPLAFEVEGRIAEILSVGTRYAAGDVLALLEEGKKLKATIAHETGRLAYYEDRLKKMTAEDNKPEIRQSEIKIEQKKKLLAEAQANLAKVSLVATEAGEVAEVMAPAGTTAKPGAPVIRAKGAGTFRAVFELPRDKADKARQLGFCRVEVEGKPLDCSLSAEGGDETHVSIELPADPAVAEGKGVRLARDKLDAVFSVPASAVVRVGDTDRLFVVGPSNRAELRLIAVADRTPSEVIVTQGIDVGDRVIVDAPPTLRDAMRVLPEPAAK